MSVYPFIEAEKVEHRNVSKACALMEVSRSAVYEWVQHQPSRREVSDAELGKRIWTQACCWGATDRRCGRSLGVCPMGSARIQRPYIPPMC